MVATELTVGNWYYSVFYHQSTDTAAVRAVKYLGRSHSWKKFVTSEGQRFSTQSTNWHKDVDNAIYAAIGEAAADWVMACQMALPQEVKNRRLDRLIRTCWMLNR